MEQKKSLEVVVGIIILLVIIGFAGWYYTKGNFTAKTPSEESPPVVFKSNSYSGIVKSVSDEKIVIIDEVDKNAKEYPPSAFAAMYDNRKEGTMKPITIKDIKKDMKVKVSTTIGNPDGSVAVILSLY